MTISQRQFQLRTGLEHSHIQIHIKDAPEIGENNNENDCIVAEITENRIRCFLPDEDEHLIYRPDYADPS